MFQADSALPDRRVKSRHELVALHTARPMELFDRHAHHARSHHAERPGGAERHVNDSPTNEWSAIIDAAAD